MKAIFISLLLIVSINAQNVWYVDRDAPTTVRDGRSWETAWATTDSVWGGGWGVNWNIVQPGDTVYISGGTDSTRYGKVGSSAPSIRGDQFDPNKPNFDPQVVVTRAWHEGHNGEVYFYKPESDTTGYAFVIRDISGIKLVDLNFYSNADFGWDGNSVHTVVTLVEENERITFENCTFTNRGTGGALGLGGSFHIIDSCLIQNLTNNSRTDQDIFTMGGGKGGHIIRNSEIIQRSVVDSTDAHPDFVQVGGSWGDETMLYETKFINNFMWQITPSRVSEYNAGFYISSGQQKHKQKITFMNNIFVLEIADTHYTGNVAGVPAIWLRGETAGGSMPEYSLRLFNNVFISPSASLLLTKCDTLLAKNNIFIQYADVKNGYALLGWVGYAAYEAAYLNLDYNHWYINNWTPYSYPNGKGFQVGDSFHKYSFGDWQGLGYDVNSDTGYVSLVDIRDSVISAYMTPESLRGKGENLSYLADEYPEIMYDILGNPRPLTGPWDIGALQYQDGQSNFINVQGKVYLQGPFNSDSMKTSLSQNSLLPPSQPYNSQPWNYSGNEVLSAGSGIVDWVLVELRNNSNPVEVVARRAAVLRNDGMLLEPNGIPGVRFYDLPAGSYYIAVFHRNHLSVMSSAPVQLSSNSGLYDFTNSMNKAYGTDPMKDLGNGRFGMYAGDGDGNGGINIYDKNEVYDSQKGSVGYLGGDFDLDTGVTAHDVNLYWNINNGREAQLPENE